MFFYGKELLSEAVTYESNGPDQVTCIKAIGVYSRRALPAESPVPNGVADGL